MRYILKSIFTLYLTSYCPIPEAGFLAGSVNNSAAEVDLTTEGTMDWVQYGDWSLNRKANVKPQISNYMVIGDVYERQYNRDLRPMTWTDGTPMSSESNNRIGIYVDHLGMGFSFSVPADRTERRVIVHVGGWNSGGVLEARLSDNSAPSYTNFHRTINGPYDLNYTLIYRAVAVNESLIITWRMNTGRGGITLSGASLQ